MGAWRVSAGMIASMLLVKIRAALDGPEMI
jgi:hypothetical protein